MSATHLLIIISGVCVRGGGGGDHEGFTHSYNNNGSMGNFHLVTKTKNLIVKTNPEYTQHITLNIIPDLNYLNLKVFLLLILGRCFSKMESKGRSNFFPDGR